MKFAFAALALSLAVGTAFADPVETPTPEPSPVAKPTLPTGVIEKLTVDELTAVVNQATAAAHAQELAQVPAFLSAAAKVRAATTSQPPPPAPKP